MSKTKNDITKIASGIYTEVIAVLGNHKAGDELREDINALFEENYGVDTAPRTRLTSLTWAQIAEIANDDNPAQHLAVGDEKVIELITGERLTAVILGFDHDILIENGELSHNNAGITFGIKEIMDGYFEMNDEDTNVGGWRNSKMRTVYMERIYKLLPPDVQAVIKLVGKPSGRGNAENEIEFTEDKLFLFSQIEVTGDSSNTADGEGIQYDYFKNKDNVIKSRSGGEAGWWWLRSPDVGNSYYFRYVNYYGYVYYDDGGASDAGGVSFGFCV